MTAQGGSRNVLIPHHESIKGAFSIQELRAGVAGALDLNGKRLVPDLRVTWVQGSVSADEAVSPLSAC